MMGKVRSALFDMLLAMCSGGPLFPATTRWLDLYAGVRALHLQPARHGIVLALHSQALS